MSASDAHGSADLAASAFDASALDTAARALGLRLVVRFGSRASHATLPPQPDSDLDLAVLAGARRLDRFSVAEALAPAFEHELDVVILNGADALIRYEAVCFGDLLWGDPDLYAQEAAYAFRAFIDSADLRRTETVLARKSLHRLLHAAT